MKNIFIFILLITTSFLIISRVLEAQNIPKSGVLDYKDGSIYIGNHLNGHPEGKGVFVSIDGMVLKGTFRKGSLTGYGLQIIDAGIGFQIRGGLFENEKFIRGTQILHAPDSESTKDLGGAFVSFVLQKAGNIDNKFKMQIFNW